ncbi:MAG TPA: WGR domain-containing protein, partial [Flavisolibacter sp.]|nr:WGR domain-containing protein [Flavisolibacter sp.]
MRLVRQVSLYFRENNSDKVYEIDLCFVGNDTYVVNFRYGRRGAVLKEGTKTPDPVSLFKAEEIFAALESEKRSKGYQSLGDAIEHDTIPLPSSLSKPQVNPDQLLPGRKRAILQRLQSAVEGKTDTRFHWKTSRVIWAAGVMKMEEAVDPILNLATKGDSMQQYAAVWALGRCNAQQAIPFFLYGFKAGNTALQRIAAAALLKVTVDNEKERQVQFHLHSLAEPLQVAIKNNNALSLRELLQERVLSQVNPHYNFLEDLYLLSQEYAWIKGPLKEIMLVVPLKPGYFKHVRHIFKLAEFFDDFEFTGTLAHRFEKEEELFKASIDAYDEDSEVFV